MALGTNRRLLEEFTALEMNPCGCLEPTVNIVGVELYVIFDTGTDDQVLALAGCFNESSEAVPGTHELFDGVWAGHVFADVICREYEYSRLFDTVYELSEPVGLDQSLGGVRGGEDNSSTRFVDESSCMAYSPLLSYL